MSTLNAAESLNITRLYERSLLIGGLFVTGLLLLVYLSRDRVGKRRKV